MNKNFNLETKLNNTFIENNISVDQQQGLHTYLNLLKNKDIPTYTHSLRVGILASYIGKFLHLDSKALLYAGLLHDIGKTLIMKETLQKTDKFDEKDYEEIQNHTEYSYRILRDIYPFSADIAIRHHYYQDRGYPETLPAYNKPYSKATRATIDFYAMIVSLADFYDAATTRINDKHGEKRKLTATEIKTLMLEKHPHFTKLIEYLYHDNIFEDEPSDHPTK
ncbi:MAG: HD domain-containing protein [Candidatus Woesearchaeota archaeon]